MRALEDVQVRAWGYADREVLPATMLRIGAHTGAVVLAAYPADDEAGAAASPFGLAYGFPALKGGQLWHHSHLLAVSPEWRGGGAAVALKLAQRERALAQGLTRMTWTFDPLVTRNARLNLGKLGARAVSYHPGWYALGEDRRAAFPADRLMIEWDLTRPHMERPAPPPDGEVVLEAQGEGPGRPRLDLAGPRLLAEVPTRADTLPEAARLAWRHALRDVLGGYLGGGYAVTDLARQGERAYYVLTRGR
ncbi:acyl-CoA acyltransferase [Deinococcus aestuarii]|uniref:acyl-CoA acyltransferase n=1 Tax=Deinococcus aestuarii TaxID=2774531 RepID=UPI001C0CCD3B|nr:acyl-CoA acyltransferase [Deinococcus aestuarii]